MMTFNERREWCIQEMKQRGVDGTVILPERPTDPFTYLEGAFTMPELMCIALNVSILSCWEEEKKA